MTNYLRKCIFVTKLARNAFKDFRNGYFDFFYFPFDINEPLPKGSIECLRDIVKLLNSWTIPYFVTDGTILGLVRDNRLIPHDTDLDISLLSALPLIRLLPHFISKGWKIGRLIMYRFKVQQLVLYRSNVVLDFTIWRPDSQYDVTFHYHRVPEVNGVRRQESIYYEWGQQYQTYDFVYYSHPNIEKWLAQRYGQSWQTPKSLKESWTNEACDIYNG